MTDGTMLAILILAAPVVAQGAGWLLKFLFLRNVNAADAQLNQLNDRLSGLATALHKAANATENLRLELEQVKGRLALAEAEAAHDKEFRKALSLVPAEVARIGADVKHVAKSVDELFDRFNTLTDTAFRLRHAGDSGAGD